MQAGRSTGRLGRTLRSIGSFLVVIALTYLGLLAVTFFIGRVIPIDPVLAIVGDRAPEHVVARVREELGLKSRFTSSLGFTCKRWPRATLAPRC